VLIMPGESVAIVTNVLIVMLFTLDGY